MSATKKRKSDIQLEKCGLRDDELPPKKEKPWFENEATDHVQEQPRTTGRKSILGGLVKRLKSKSALREQTNERTAVVLSETLPGNFSDVSHVSQNSESSVSVVSEINENVRKNAELKAFLHRDSVNAKDVKEIADGENRRAPNDSQLDDSTSIASQSLLNLGDEKGFEDDYNDVDEDYRSRMTSCDGVSLTSFCTPLRMTRGSAARCSSRSVPDTNDAETQLYRGLCDSVRRAQSTLIAEDGCGFGRQRSMRLRNNRIITAAGSMEDVPEEDVLHDTGAPSTVVERLAPTADAEVFVDGPQFFAGISTSAEDCSSSDASHTPSMGRRHSMWKVKSFLFGSGKSYKARDSPSTISTRASISCDDPTVISATKSFAADGVGASASLSTTSTTMGMAQRRMSLTQPVTSSGGVVAPKLRRQAPSASNLQRFSALFRKSAQNSDEPSLTPELKKSKAEKIIRRGSSLLRLANIGTDTLRRNTLSSHPTMNQGQDEEAKAAGVVRRTSKLEAENLERKKRFLRKVTVSDVPANELIRQFRFAKLAAKRAQEKREAESKGDDVVDENNPEEDVDIDDGASIATLNDEKVGGKEERHTFDVVAIDVTSDGKPCSSTSREVVNDELTRMIRFELMGNCETCGTVSGCEPMDVVFVCPKQTQSYAPDLNDTIGTSHLDRSLLPNVRNGLSKAVQLWNKVGRKQETNSTLLLYPMFCATADEWDAPETIKAVFDMLDAVVHTKQWRKDGRCLLAGVTENNCRLLCERYELLRRSIEVVDDEKDDDDENEEVNKKNDKASDDVDGGSESEVVYCTKV